LISVRGGAYNAGGVYVNFMMDEGEGCLKTTFSDNYERSVKIFDKYDPNSLFRVNQNIELTPLN
jgi:hypothetical protein